MGLFYPSKIFFYYLAQLSLNQLFNSKPTTKILNKFLLIIMVQICCSQWHSLSKSLNVDGTIDVDAHTILTYG